MTSPRRSTGSVRRPDVLPHTLFVSQVHLKGRLFLGGIEIIIIYYFVVDTDGCDESLFACFDSSVSSQMC